MKLKLLLFSVVTVCGLQATAQPWISDSISMGAQAGPIGYARDVYYSMKNGTVDSTQSNTNWHIAFEMLPPGPNGNVGIRANHTQQGVTVYSLNLQGSVKFGALLAGDTIGKLSKPLYNTDTNLHWGAFNQNRSTSVFDYGWGTYNMSSHHVDGDSLYLIKIAPTGGPISWYQLWVKHYHSTPSDTIHYSFSIAKFDNTGIVSKVIYRKPTYTNKNFVYYDVINDMVLDREPDNATWDIIFTRYHDMNAGPVAGTPYPTTGVLSNFGVQVAAIKNVSPDTCKYWNYSYSAFSNKIGYNWKTFVMNPPPGFYTVDTSATYFVKLVNGAYYQIKFTRFDGASTGKTVFSKRLVGFPISVNETANKVQAFAVVPNPAVNQTSIMLDANENGTAVIMVSDITGKLVEKNTISVSKGLNGYRINTGNYTTGTYVVTVSNGSWKLSQKLIVQH